MDSCYIALRIGSASLQRTFATYSDIFKKLDISIENINMTKNRPTILIVDDVPGNIKTSAAVLEQNFEVLVAINGIDALKAISSNTVDLILLDIEMPGMDGYEVCRQLKTDPTTDSIPVIFLTSHGAVMDEAKGFMVGAADYILKPIDPIILKIRVNTQIIVANHLTLEKKLSNRILELEDELRVMKSSINQIINK
jgi:PleD family two-component response regulator